MSGVLVVLEQSGQQSGGVGQVSIRVERIHLPEKSRRSQIFDGPPKEAAAKLVEKLRFEARVI